MSRSFANLILDEWRDGVRHFTLRTINRALWVTGDAQGAHQ